MPSPTQLDELASSLDDPAALLTTGLERFTTPARGAAGAAELVVAPRDTAAVRDVVAWARRHRIRLLPQGANTGLVGASTPGPEGGVVVLSTDRLRGEVVVDPLDRTALVPAGTRLSELNEVLAPHGLHLPIDLGADPSIGGMAATNTGGARMLRHGDMRRHVLGVQAVLADDRQSVVDEASVLRKDNTGLALSELLVGSGGALGVITRVALEVDPLPARVACAWLEPADGDAAARAVLLLEELAGDRLSAYEVISRAALRAALELVDGLHRPFERELPPEWTVLVEFAGDAGTDDALVAALAALVEHELVVDAVVGPPEQIWAVRHAISEGLRRRGTIVGFDVSVPRSRLAEFVAVVRHEVALLLPRTFVADFGHWGDGGVHCSVIVPFDEPLTRTEHDELRSLVFGTVVDRFGGSFSGEHGIGPVNAEWWARTRSAGAQLLSHGIKALCDPLDVLGHPAMPYRVPNTDAPADVPSA
jgi:FAD/FMN-containing dehydrogenase